MQTDVAKKEAVRVILRGVPKSRWAAGDETLAERAAKQQNKPSSRTISTEKATRIGQDATRKLRERVANEITTTFASTFTREISLTEALDPDTIRAYRRAKTGEKYLIVPANE